MSKFYIALALVEQMIKGNRIYTQPGSPVHNLNEKDVAALLKVKAIRKPTEAEAALEEAVAASRAKSKPESEDKDDKDDKDDTDGADDKTPAKTTTRARNRGNAGDSGI